MAGDSYREVTQRSWSSRIGGAMKGIVVGIALLLGAFTLLFWNEGRAVERYKSLKEGGGAVISVAADRIDQSNEGRLVHLSGLAASGEVLVDPIVGVMVNAIKLVRKVEMYQWAESSRSETKKKLGGGEETVTTYSYETRWAERPIDSGAFKKPEGHGNPPMPYLSETIVSSEVRLGAFRLPPFLVEQIGGSKPLPLEGAVVEKMTLPSQGKLASNGIYLGRAANKPEVGDIRVHFSVVADTVVSVVAQQQGDSLRLYQTKAGGSVALLQLGEVAADAMFAQAQQSNTILTWLLRAAGLVLMFLGLRTVLGPLAVLSDVVPAIGSLVGAGLTMISGLAAVILGSLTVAVAWVFYRPLIGITLFVLALVLGFFMLKKMRQAARKGGAQPQAETPPPVPGS